MNKQFPTWILAGLGLILAIANAVAIRFHLFFFVSWLDIPMHVIGGLWVGLLTLAYYYSPRIKEPKNHSDTRALRLAVLATLIVGVTWELFEFSLDKFIVFGPHDLKDSMDDLLNDLIGAVFAAEIFVTERYNRIVNSVNKNV